MARPVDQQICFRLADAVPAVSLPQPLRLGDAQAEALSGRHGARVHAQA